MSDFSLAGLGVAIIAPSGYAPDEAAFLQAIERLQAQGCRVHNYYQADKKFQRFGGSDTERLAQLYAAVDNPDVQIVIALRGGYGLSRLLPSLDFKKIAASGKLFIGHSDFTPFHIGMLGAGAVSFAGPMICSDFTGDTLSTFTMQHYWSCLAGPTYTVSVQSANNPVVEVTGQLWGGNLTMLTHLIGTPYLPVIEDGILFVEDIAEHPYRIERMLLQLHYCGVLSRQKALVLGDFSSYRLTDYDNGFDFEAMLVYLRQQLPIPILAGLPFGHIRDKVTLPVGAQAHLKSDGDSWALTMSHYPTLPQLHVAK